MPKELPEIVGATHIAFFVRWCIENSLMSQEVQENFAEELQRIANKELDCREFFFNDMDGVFTSEELNTKGEKFAAAYYHSEKTKVDNTPVPPDGCKLQPINYNEIGDLCF